MAAPRLLAVLVRAAEAGRENLLVPGPGELAFTFPAGDGRLAEVPLALESLRAHKESGHGVSQVQHEVDPRSWG